MLPTLAAVATLSLTQAEPAILPEPKSVRVGEGMFELRPDTVVVAPTDLRAKAEQLRGYLCPATGFEFPIVGRRPRGKGAIVLAKDAKLAALGGEGYRLASTPSGVEIRAAAEAGVFYGMQTLRQLLPSDVFRQAPIAGVRWTVPVVAIEDRPRFAWRGSMIDSARWFMPKEFVKKYLDLLALHKLNTLHMHLTDDQGWRIEIKKYPKLTEVGAWRAQTLVGHYSENLKEAKYDGQRHGGFYTQDDVREIVAYAAARHITVVPEIEMPGHAQAAIAAYPELGNTGRALEVHPTWGVNENVFNVNENTILFLQDVLTEVIALFPSKFIHIGGDECPKKQWRESPVAQARKQELGLKDEDELQSWFVRSMDTFLDGKGRRLIGWDEILEGGLAEGATVMSWRGIQGGVTAAKAGHDVVMSPTSHLYLDYRQSRDPGEPLAIGGFLPLARVYSYEPIPAGLSDDEAKHVLGAQGNVWTEYIPTPKRFEYFAFPRLCALAEVVWTPKERKDYARFLAALKAHGKRLEALDVNYRRPTDADATMPDRFEEEE